MREEEKLERLWEACRRATPEPEASANFMPELWMRIEAARPTPWAMPFARLAARLIPVAAVVCLAMGLYLGIGRDSSIPGYVDVLAADLLASVEDRI